MLICKGLLIASPFNQASVLAHSIQARGNKYGNWIAFPSFEREPEKAIYYDIYYILIDVYGGHIIVALQAIC